MTDGVTEIDLGPDDPEEIERWSHRLRGYLSAPETVAAYVNHGRWIADCSYPDCNSAEALDPMQPVFHCSNCRHTATVVWPQEAGEIDRVLSQRPVPQTRNWAPPGHRQAIVCGFPDGQSVPDLMDENLMHGVGV